MGAATGYVGGSLACQHCRTKFPIRHFHEIPFFDAFSTAKCLTTLSVGGKMAATAGLQGREAESPTTPLIR